MEEDEEYLAELYAIERAADKVETAEDFVEFLRLLQKEILEDDELAQRLQVVFLQVIEGKLNFSIKFPDDDGYIEIPENPDWNWIARLFLIGAFEN